MKKIEIQQQKYHKGNKKRKILLNIFHMYVCHKITLKKLHLVRIKK